MAYIAKKKTWKNGHFSTKTMGYSLWKNLNFSTFWTSFFYRLEKRFFVVEYCKTNFRGLYCLKRRHGKMAIFWPKPWVNPFGKISIFRLFEVLFFYGLERRFCVVEYFKTHFPGLYCLKKRLEKWPFFDQNHGLIPLEKSQFFVFLNCFFL